MGYSFFLFWMLLLAVPLLYWGSSRSWREVADGLGYWFFLSGILLIPAWGLFHFVLIPGALTPLYFSADLRFTWVLWGYMGMMGLHHQIGPKVQNCFKFKPEGDLSYPVLISISYIGVCLHDATSFVSVLQLFVLSIAGTGIAMAIGLSLIKREPLSNDWISDALCFSKILIQLGFLGLIMQYLFGVVYI